MKPYYSETGIIIYCGDARDLIPDLSQLDATITDPPYGVDGGHGGQTRDYRKADYTSDFADNPDYIRTVCAPIIEACLKISKTVVFTPGTRCLSSYPQPDDVGDFYAPASPRKGRFGFSMCNPIFYYGWYKNRGGGALPTSMILTEVAEDNGHPCPKPYKAWRWLVERSTEPDALVFDPFMGSGTTLRACKDLGRRAIGIDLDERYCEIAVNSLRQSVLFPSISI